MTTTPRNDDRSRTVGIGPPEDSGTGVQAVATAVARTVGHMGVRRTLRAMAVINQPAGFDCPGCAWPEPAPGERKHIEFCENGAKAVAEEAMRARAGREFFSSHSIDDLRGRENLHVAAPGNGMNAEPHHRSHRRSERLDNEGVKRACLGAGIHLGFYGRQVEIGK